MLKLTSLPGIVRWWLPAPAQTAVSRNSAVTNTIPPLLIQLVSWHKGAGKEVPSLCHQDYTPGTRRRKNVGEPRSASYRPAGGLRKTLPVLRQLVNSILSPSDKSPSRTVGKTVNDTLSCVTLNVPHAVFFFVGNPVQSNDQNVSAVGPKPVTSANTKCLCVLRWRFSRTQHVGVCLGVESILFWPNFTVPDDTTHQVWLPQAWKYEKFKIYVTFPVTDYKKQNKIKNKIQTFFDQTG